MTGRLEGKVALVTGGSSGIGRASAQALAEEGAKVVVADVAVEGGEETVGMIQEGGGEAIFVRADVSKGAEVEAMVNKAVETWGRLDCAHNNAGIAEPRVLTADLAEETWDRIINVNLKGMWLCLKYEILQMLKQGGGAIVNTSSVIGLVAVRHQPAYIASKHGVVGLTKAAALEYARAGIRVNAVCPAAIRTPALEWFIRENPQVEEQLIAQNPMGRLGTPEEVAAAVVWLCSDAASYITGHSMVVDGGVIAQ
jgi:NAD(P)-dependent dehydrogenase (short-subunit alcohol dehydrogenase family)